MKPASGHRVAAAARRLGLHPIAPDGMVPDRTMCAIADNGDCYDLADIFDALTDRVLVLERLTAAMDGRHVLATECQHSMPRDEGSGR